MTVVAVDLGRSGARVLRRTPGAADVRATTSTGAGLGDPGGAATVAAALRVAVGDPPGRAWSLVVGVPGALTHRRAAGELADLLASGWAGPDPVEVAVTSDVVGWHAGAAVENAEDDDAAGRADVAGLGVEAGDVVVGVAASGRTPYVLGALRAADEAGAATVAVVNATGSPAAAVAGTAVELVTGPEVLAGSTRLAAGTAQKIALNTLTTAAMVRTGATYGPWMVGVRVTNAKLRRRAERIVRDAAGVDITRARAALVAARHDVGAALVVLLGGLDGDAARERLAAAGSVRAAVDRPGADPGTAAAGEPTG